MFWDSSGIVPCIVAEARSPETTPLLLSDTAIVVWWGTLVECVSALEQKRRIAQSPLASATYATARTRLNGIVSAATIVQPIDTVRENAVALLESHALRAADALQLAAALASGQPEFVCLDARLSTAALGEGLQIRP